MVVEDGLTVRCAGLTVTLLWIKPSDHVTVHGPVPVSAAWIVTPHCGPVVVVPLTNAVGSGLTVTATQVCVHTQPLVAVTVTQ